MWIIFFACRAINGFYCFYFSVFWQKFSSPHIFIALPCHFLCIFVWNFMRGSSILLSPPSLLLCLSISAGDSCALEACHQSLRLTASVRVWGSTKSVPYLRDTAFLNFLQSLKTGNFPQICSTWSLLPDIVPGTLQMPLFVFFPARASHVQCAASFWFFFWLHLFCLLLACFLHMTRSWLKMNCSVQY